jgi:hypothetical protein
MAFCGGSERVRLRVNAEVSASPAAIPQAHTLNPRIRNCRTICPRIAPSAGLNPNIR